MAWKSQDACQVARGLRSCVWVSATFQPIPGMLSGTARLWSGFILRCCHCIERSSGHGQSGQRLVTQWQATKGPDILILTRKCVVAYADGAEDHRASG